MPAEVSKQSQDSERVELESECLDNNLLELEDQERSQFRRRKLNHKK